MDKISKICYSFYKKEQKTCALPVARVFCLCVRTRNAPGRVCAHTYEERKEEKADEQDHPQRIPQDRGSGGHERRHRRRAGGLRVGRVYAQIHDDNWYEDVQRFHTIGCSAQTRNGGPDYVLPKMEEAEAAGCFFRADTLDELADKLGFTGEAKDTFLATVERYNELYDAQEDTDFGKPAYRLSAIRKAPFYGCWLGASLLTTEQGIAINEKGQALDTNNQPMPGLYVTGDMSGSFFANNYPCLMAGVAMGRTMTFAIKAIKQMAGLEEV